MDIRRSLFGQVIAAGLIVGLFGAHAVAVDHLGGGTNGDQRWARRQVRRLASRSIIGNKRSISLRRLYISRSYSHGSSREADCHDGYKPQCQS